MSKILSILPSDIDQAKVIKAIKQILESNHLLSLATVDLNGSPYINTAYFSGNKDKLYIFTPPNSQHGNNITKNPIVAATIFDSSQQWGSDLVGLQLFGKMYRLSGTSAINAFKSYTKRFARLLRWTNAYKDVERIFESRFYEFKVSKYKLLDEQRFGEENYITMTIN